MTRVLLLLVALAAVFAGDATAQEHSFTLSPKANSLLDQRVRARVVFTDASRRLGVTVRPAEVPRHPAPLGVHRSQGHERVGLVLSGCALEPSCNRLTRAAGAAQTKTPKPGTITSNR